MKTLFFFLLIAITSFSAICQDMPKKQRDQYENIMFEPFDVRLKAIDEWLKKNPNDAWYHYMKASVLAQMNEDDQAKKHYEISIQLDSTIAMNYFEMANLISSDSKDSAKVKQALVYMNKAILLAPDEDYYKIERAYLYIDLNDYVAADKEADYLLSRPQFDLMAPELLKIETLFLLGKKDQLFQFIEKHDLSDNGEFMGLKQCLILASIYEEMGDFEKVCKLYRGAAEPFLMMEEQVPELLTSKLAKCK